MKNIVLVLSTTKTPEKAIDFAVKEASARGARLIALYVLEQAVSKDVFDRFTDIGFIGDKPSKELSEAIMKEYRQRGYEELGRVQIKAMESAVDFDTVMTEGDYVAATLRLVEEKGVGLCVVIRRKRSALGRYFSRSPADEIKDSTPCDVCVFDEE
ncbi:MAG: universal stress protein [Deltaproteobacteria bacterium]|nr:universal stress protein [Deltaproteobacteria bacterium]